MWIGIPARVCARRPVRPRVARARALDATVAPPVANACARCASIVVVVVVVDCRRRARVEGVSGVVASRRGPSRVGKQCDDATRGDRFVCVHSANTRSVGRGRAARPRRVPRRARRRARRRATATATATRTRARPPRERRPVGRSRIANRARVARIARETRATLGFHAPAPRARIRRARIRRRVGEATRGAGEGSRGVVEGSRAASASREAIARRAGPGDDGRARAHSCGCTFPRVVTRRIRDADPPGCGADSARIRGRWRWRCDGWSPCRSSAKRARARVKRRRAR